MDDLEGVGVGLAVKRSKGVAYHCFSYSIHPVGINDTPSWRVMHGRAALLGGQQHPNPNVFTNNPTYPQSNLNPWCGTLFGSKQTNLILRGVCVACRPSSTCQHGQHAIPVAVAVRVQVGEAVLVAGKERGQGAILALLI